MAWKQRTTKRTATNMAGNLYAISIVRRTACSRRSPALRPEPCQELVLAMAWLLSCGLPPVP